MVFAIRQRLARARTGSLARAFAALALALVADDVMVGAAIASGVWFRGR